MKPVQIAHKHWKGIFSCVVFVGMSSLCFLLDVRHSVATGRDAMAEEFWVIFDTSTLRDYYRDVHNVLAAPEGVVIRYEYRTKYLSDAAIALAERPSPRAVLLLYAQQDTQYPRSEGKSAPSDPSVADELVFATRLATMVNVTKDGENYYFDFQVAEYPNQDQTALATILGTLETQGTVPWKNRKWVATSTLHEKLDVLKIGEIQQNWTEIVNRLSTPPVQFSGDAFWRLEGPFQAGSQSPTRPSIEYDTEPGRPPRARSYFQITETSSWKFDLVSETSGKAQYDVAGESSDPKILELMGAPKYGLRQYTRQAIDYRARSTALFGDVAADLTLDTLPRNADWPSGPRLSFRYEQQRNWRRIVFGFGSGLVGLVLLVLSGFILTGRIAFKP